MITDYEGAPYTPEQLLELLDEVGDNDPAFKPAYASLNTWEEGQRLSQRQADASSHVVNRDVLADIIANDERELVAMLPNAMPPRQHPPKVQTGQTQTFQEAPAPLKRGPKRRERQPAQGFAPDREGHGYSLEGCSLEGCQGPKREALSLFQQR